jgi:stage II sporulation protein D
VRRLFLFALLLSAVSSVQAREVRIGVFTLFHPAELDVRPAPGSVLRVQAGDQLLQLESLDVMHLRLAEDSIDWTWGTRSGRASSLSLSARDGSAVDFILAVPEKIHRRYSGRLSVTASGGALRPVITTDLELAVASVVAAESPPNAPIEALKAQAVVARSYYASGAQHRGPQHLEFDFCDTTHCQLLRQPPAQNSPAWQATLHTAGLVLAFEGATLPAMYTASCGGRTRTLAEIGVKARGYPYFAVECKFCREHPQEWNADLSSAEAEALLKNPGEQERLAIGRRRGWNTVPGNNYRATLNGDRVLLSGSGKGHGVGLCQRGAAGMAADGATFQEILGHYYPNTALAHLP